MSSSEDEGGIDITQLVDQMQKMQNKQRKSKQKKILSAANKIASEHPAALALAIEEMTANRMEIMKRGMESYASDREAVSHAYTGLMQLLGEFFETYKSLAQAVGALNQDRHGQAQELKKDLERELNEARSTTTQGLMEIMRRVANEDGLALPDVQIHQRRMTNPGGVDDSAIAFSV